MTTVCYIRKPADYFVSATQQILKGSHRLDTLNPMKPFYATSLERWLNETEVIVREFTRTNLRNGDVLEDLLYYGGLKDVDVRKIERVSLNETISAESMYILQRFRAKEFSRVPNVFVPEANRLLVLLMRFESALGGLKHFTKPKLKEPFNSYFRSATPDALYLRDRLNLEFSDTDYTSHLPWPDVPMNTVADIIDVDMEKAEELQIRLINHLLKAAS